MGQIGFIFQEDTLDKYNLKTNECFILDWLIWFIDSGKQDYIQKSGKIYYWVKYSKVMADTSKRTGIIGEKTISKLFNSLCEKKVLDKIDSGKNYKRRLYFRFCDGVKEELKKGASEMKLLNVPAQKSKKTAKLNPMVYDLLKQAKTLTIPSEKGSKVETIPLFTFRLPETNETNKNNLKHFNKVVLDIYNGNFTQRNYPLSPDFLKRQEKYIDEVKTYDAIKECKGDWYKTIDFIYFAMVYYQLWFKPDREPLCNKQFLYKAHREIGDWIYNDFCKESYFLACVLYKPFPRQDRIVQKIIDTLPDNVYEKAKEIESLKFPAISEKDKNSFWFGVNDVVKAEKRLCDITVNNQYTLDLWLGDVFGSWTCKYLDWLVDCYGEKTDLYLKPYNVGIKSSLWERWMGSDVDVVEQYGLDFLLKTSRNEQ